MQNMVVADREGHIGFVAPGRVPLRRPENDLKGQVPSPGWDARYDWAGSVPLDETPREMDPARGYIATANQRVVPPDYPYYLTNDWAEPFRYERIVQMLESKPKQSLADLAAIQADLKSLAALPLLPWLQKAQSTHALAAAAHQALAGFDGTMAADRAAPLIYWAWLRHLTLQVFDDDLGPALAQRLAGRSFRDALQGVLQRDDTSWCDDHRTPVVESCAMQAGTALTQALDELQARYGSDVSSWRWDAAHIARSEHRPFSRVKWLSRLFELRTPVGGDTNTVNVSRVGLRADATTGEYYLDEHGPSMRALYDVADPTQSRFMFSTGQSGLPFSPLYRSFVEHWAKVEYLPLWGAGPAANVLLISPQTAP
jgi:penicillin amidase